MLSWGSHQLPWTVEGVWTPGNLERSLRRIPLLHLTSLSDGLQALPKFIGTNQAHGAASPHRAKPHRKCLSRESQALICPDTSFFRAVFSCLTQVLWVPASWVRRLLAKHERNHRKDIGESPVIAEPTDIPRNVTGAGAARNVLGFGKKDKKILQISRERA